MLLVVVEVDVFVFLPVKVYKIVDVEVLDRADDLEIKLVDEEDLDKEEDLVDVWVVVRVFVDVDVGDGNHVPIGLLDVVIDLVEVFDIVDVAVCTTPLSPITSKQNIKNSLIIILSHGFRLKWISQHPLLTHYR